MGPGGSHWTEERKGLLRLCPAAPGEQEQSLGRIELASFRKLKRERASVRTDSAWKQSPAHHQSRTSNKLSSGDENLSLKGSLSGQIWSETF